VSPAAFAGWVAFGSAVLAIGAALGLPLSIRARAVGALSVALAGAAGACALMVLVSGDPATLSLAWLLPLSGLQLVLDPLGAWFVLIVAVVGIAASVYGAGSAAGETASRPVQVMLPLYIAAMLLVPAAASVTSFLVFWELMALSSLVLVLSEHRSRRDVRAAGLWYAVMTHLGFLAVLGGLAFYAGLAGGQSFAVLRAAGPGLPVLARAVVFGLVLIGFGSKAGAFPLHVGLARADPEAPSHVAALMSGAMVKLGVYGLVRVLLDLLGGGPSWWGIVVLVVGGTSALFGILHAMVSSDLKRLLAYSTTENIGIILIGVGAALLFGAAGSVVLASAVLAAALLHSLNHALFKGLLFLGAGSAHRATGTRDLDDMGGLLRRMPWTGALFGLGAMAIAALPPFNGFVSEWLLFQGLVRSFPASDSSIAVMVPIALGALALTGGLAAAVFVKAFGIGFLAIPRSDAAARAEESPWTMRTGMLLLAAGCVLLGVLPSLVLTPLRHALEAVRGVGAPDALGRDSWQLSVSGVGSALAPLLVALALVVALVGVAALARLATRHSQRRSAENWGGGRVGQTPAMEYNATSFAEPVQRVFDDVLRPDLDLKVDHRVESSFFVDRIRYRAVIHDATEERVYGPMIRYLRRWGEVARGIQNGSVHRYLAYGLLTVVVVLVVAR
jgi:hydrogenase-4 component B